MRQNDFLRNATGAAQRTIAAMSGCGYFLADYLRVTWFLVLFMAVSRCLKSTIDYKFLTYFRARFCQWQITPRGAKKMAVENG